VGGVERQERDISLICEDYLHSVLISKVIRRRGEGGHEELLHCI
jgi:hypothetical protein